MKSKNTRANRSASKGKKKPYTSPKVFSYGSVEKLTMSKTGNARDAKSKKT